MGFYETSSKGIVRVVCTVRGVVGVSCNSLKVLVKLHAGCKVVAHNNLGEGDSTRNPSLKGDQRVIKWRFMCVCTYISVCAFV